MISRMVVIFILLWISIPTAMAEIRIKSIARIQGLQDNPLTGYGLVTGLAGSGDSRRNRDTTQAISNMLQGFGVTVSPNEINTRNSATVMISANLPPFASQGDRLDIQVASLGDAKSLAGGTLLTAPLKGPDNQIYALAQGAISIGGFKFDQFGNSVQKNHPTTGLIPNGAIVEQTIYNDLTDKTGDLYLVLNRPDFTNAVAIEKAVNRHFGMAAAKARSAQNIQIHPPKANQNIIHFISEMENITIIPDTIPTVVINERNGVIVAGAEVTIRPVTISQGNLQISISTGYAVSQPTLLLRPNPEIHTAITPDTAIQVTEPTANPIYLEKETSIAEFMSNLNKAKTSTRDIIAILQSLQKAGALQAELVIQ